MEAEAVVGVQRRVLAADAVEPRDVILQAVAPVQVPVAQLIFFGTQVFLASRFSWLMLQQLEGRPIDAVAGAQGCGQSHSQHESRAPAELQELREDVRRV